MFGEQISKKIAGTLQPIYNILRMPLKIENVTVGNIHLFRLRVKSCRYNIEGFQCSRMENIMQRPNQITK